MFSRRAYTPIIALIIAAAAVAQNYPVTIHRDDFGVPHIYASSEELGFYGIGYAEAEDNLEGLLLMFLEARGERAAVSGSEFLESDLASRLWMHAEEARVGFARLSPQLQNNYRYYIGGIQRYMHEHPADVPKWAPKLEPSDALALSRWSLWLDYQAGMGLADCRRGGGQLSGALQTAVDRQRQFGSDEWVVAPWRTADHATVVLSDPHGGISEGSLLFEFGLDAGGMKIAGYAIGAPADSDPQPHGGVGHDDGIAGRQRPLRNRC